MRRETVGLTVLLVLAAPFVPGRARACDPAFPSPHTIDPAQVGVDQTPPQLAQPMVAELQNHDVGGGGCMGTGKCGWEHSVILTNLATDDLTPVERIGYRVTLVAGAATFLTTGGGQPIVGSSDGSLMLFWDGENDFDFTLQLIAVDAAGNESEPRTVRINQGGGGCSIVHRRASYGFTLAVLALALAIAAARPLQRRR
jgi:hypothetical protein